MKIRIPGSKSISNRALLLAALAEGKSHLQNLQISDDILAMIGALRVLGVSIALDSQKQSADVIGCQGRFPQLKAKIDCHESGTLLRFLLTVCAGVPGVYQFDGDASLRQRPIEAQIKMLISLGIHCSNLTLPLELNSQQKLPGGEVTVDGSQTGQPISALLMMAPFMQKPLTLQVRDAVSRPYIEMTCRMMEEFGVSVNGQENGWHVPLAQHYQSRNYRIESDWSTASYFLAGAAITGKELTLGNISRANSLQGDARFLAILEQMGCTVNETADAVTLQGPQRLNGIEVNLSDSPDIFMTLAALAPFASTPTRISGIAHAQLKESNRLVAMAKGLKQLGVRLEEKNDGLLIYPSQIKPREVDTCHDHRIAMSFSVIGLKHDILLSDTDCVAKSCPEFFDLWKIFDDQ